MTNTVIAVKMFKESRLYGTQMDLGREHKKPLDEANISKRLDHGNVIPLLKLVKTDDEICLVFPLMTHSLEFEIYDKAYMCTQHRTREIIRMILSGHHIVHCGFKPENILVDSNGSVKIADFGLSTIYFSARPLKGQCGTKPYKAPEMLLDLAYGDTIDIWVNL